MPLTALTGANVVLPDAIVPGNVVLDDDRIVAIEPVGAREPHVDVTLDCAGGWLVPGFVDVHVHGLRGVDVLDGPDAVRDVARTLPEYGVTAFCPTSLACTPEDLAVFLAAVATSQNEPERGDRARVIGAHLESNFINPDYCGAQPVACLRRPPAAAAVADAGPFNAADVMAVITRYRRAVAIVTVAPELDGGLALVRDLVACGHIVSIGHTGATLDEANAAIEAGARHATHLFNRMPPIGHRAPGAAGAVLASDQVLVELICDGAHVHPSMIRLAVAAKGLDRVMAITDGTAGSGLPVGTQTHLGRQPIVVTERTAELADGTLAGSVLTMDGAFRLLVQTVGLSPIAAATVCATTPAAALGQVNRGVIRVGAVADLVCLDEDFKVRRTLIAGRTAFSR